MISYLKGAITYKSPTNIIVETAGVGYEVLISLHTYAQIEPLEQVKILTYHYIKEDQQTLYGFADDSERKLFGQLISVSGVGPSTAQVLLSTLAPDEVRLRKRWYIVVACGRSLYKEGAGEWLTRKEVHRFLNPPGELGFDAADLRAQRLDLLL